MVLAYIIVLKSATFHAEILSVLKKKIEGEDHKLILNGSKNKRYRVVGWIFLKLTVNQARSKNKNNLAECKTILCSWAESQNEIQ